MAPPSIKDQNGQQVNGWTTWSRHVLAELVRLDEEIDSINIALTEIKIQIAVLQFKSGVWGAIGAAVTIAITLGIWFLTRR